MGQWLGGDGYLGDGPVPEPFSQPRNSLSRIKGWHLAVLAILLLLIGCVGAIELFGHTDTETGVFFSTGIHPLERN